MLGLPTKVASYLSRRNSCFTKIDFLKHKPVVLANNPAYTAPTNTIPTKRKCANFPRPRPTSIPLSSNKKVRIPSPITKQMDVEKNLKSPSDNQLPGKFPSYAQLICRHPYGRSSRNYKFSGEVVFDHILIHIYHAGYANDD